MSYTPEHTAETRARIVDSARRLLKSRGYKGVSIDAVMADAGLTRGGFYLHFPSKTALLAEVVADGGLLSSLREYAATPTAEPDDWLLQVFDKYLSMGHRNTPEHGCPFAALSPDVARVDSADARNAYAKNLEQLRREIGGRLQEDADCAPETATAVIALCVGAMVMARALPDPADAQAVLESCRRTIRTLV